MIKNLGKAKYLTLLNIYIPDLIIAWIDENDENIKTMFNLTITVAESLPKILPVVQQEHPIKKKQIFKLINFFGNAISTEGDMTQEQADSFLNDLTKDGKLIYSEKSKNLDQSFSPYKRFMVMKFPYMPSILSTAGKASNPKNRLT